MVPFLILMALCTAVIIGSLKVSSSSMRTIYATKERTQRYYTTESGMNRSLSWLRTNSQSLVTPFKGSEFYQKFERTEPTIGANDTGLFKVPTKVKLAGTNNSAILNNDPSFGTAAYPATSNIVTNAGFDAVGSFETKDLGGALLRVTLVDAVPIEAAKDTPPNPDTDFYPVYRVDALSGPNRGVHTYGFVTGNLYYVDTVGFYGKDYVNVNQDCSSAVFTGASPGPRNAKCPVGSNAKISIANNAEIYGSARTNGSIDPASKVCADYPSCTKQGKTCEGANCAVPAIPTYQNWDIYCPAPPALPNITVNNTANPKKGGGGQAPPAAGCYDTVTLENGTLVLNAVAQPAATFTEMRNSRYFFKTLYFKGGQSALRVSPAVAGGTVELYVMNITGDNINGSQTVNDAAKPSQFRIHYLGANDLKINGNSDTGFAMVAPYANVTLTGNSRFGGGIMAKGLDLSGSSELVYDETLGGTILNDLTLRLRNLAERYN